MTDKSTVHFFLTSLSHFHMHPLNKWPQKQWLIDGFYKLTHKLYTSLSSWLQTKVTYRKAWKSSSTGLSLRGDRKKKRRGVIFYMKNMRIMWARWKEVCVETQYCSSKLSCVIIEVEGQEPSCSVGSTLCGMWRQRQIKLQKLWDTNWNSTRKRTNWKILKSCPYSVCESEWDKANKCQ